jgi:hypothetical protein
VLAARRSRINREVEELLQQPEPSHRFIFWSGVIAVVVLTAVIALDYAKSWSQ